MAAISMAVSQGVSHLHLGAWSKRGSTFPPTPRAIPGTPAGLGRPEEHIDKHSENHLVLRTTGCNAPGPDRQQLLQ